MKRKRLKKIIANAIVYTINARNVDELNGIWLYDSYNVELGKGRNNDRDNNYR